MELELLEPFWEGIEKLTTSRTASTKKVAMMVYKEFFLWMGMEPLKQKLMNLKEPLQKEIMEWCEKQDPSKMKQLVSGTGKKEKMVDFYDVAKEQDLDKRYSGDEWIDEYLDQKKWKEKQRLILELIAVLKKIPKLKKKTKTHHFFQ